MCGRFTLRTDAKKVAEFFDADLHGVDFGPSWNLAPTDPVLVVRRADGGVGGRELARARWGLLPGWVDDADDFPTLINARSETAREKPAFRDAFRSRRCLIPADGFYEWVRVDGDKQPFYVRRRDDRLFAFAGLWERRAGEDGPQDSCTILTTEPNDLVARLHDRMPVVLPDDAHEAWLDPAGYPGDLEELLRPYPDPDDDFEAYPVTKRVNSPRHDEPQLVKPLV
jgi:putative SOS response-associated peptidase YedK